MEAPGFVYPQRLPNVPDEAMDLWEGCAGLARTAAVRARLHHLCFERKWQSPGAHLQAAAAAYLEVGLDAGWHRLARSDALGWAVELARKTGDEALFSRTMDALVDLATVSMAQERPEPGGGTRGYPGGREPTTRRSPTRCAPGARPDRLPRRVHHRAARGHATTARQGGTLTGSKPSTARMSRRGWRKPSGRPGQ